MTPSISVIIVTYERPLEVSRLVNGIKVAQAEGVITDEIEICIVNNGAAPKSTLEAQVDVWLDPGSNLGASGGRNAGVAATHAPLLLFLDDDAVFEANGISYINTVFQDQSLSAIRGRVIPLEHPLFNCVSHMYNQGQHVIPDLLTLEGVTVIRREIYEAVGGYCVDQFAGEGMELSERILQRFPQARIEYHPNLVIAHDYVSSWKELWKKAQRNYKGKETYRVHENPQAAQNLIAAKKRYRSYSIPDGRSRAQRTIAYLIMLLYKLSVGWFRFKNLLLH